MALHIGEEAPNFTAETTEGTINFHDWIGNGWAILFPIRKISPRFAPQSSATWRVSNQSSRSETVK